MGISIKQLGPGLLYAGAAVGVSHLVQSTRAGASYGLIMIAVVITANVLKYPFFKAGPIYAAQSGKSLLEAFHEEGKLAMALFYIATIGTMFAVQAGVTLITASVVSSIFCLSLPLWQVSAGILAICFSILVIGKYKWLNGIIKWVILLLSVTTLITLIAAFAQPVEKAVESIAFDFSNTVDVLFLIALVGWMPAPLDISLWHSEWTLADLHKKSVPTALLDFKIGYWGTTLLAIVFIALGSLILRGSDETLSSSGAVFASQVIGMYTTTLGDWAFAIVATAAFTTMFSTTLTVLDAFPRVLDKAIGLSFNKPVGKSYVWLLLVTILGALTVLIYLMENMKQLIDLATSISFITAPILAFLMLKVCWKNKAVLNYFSKSEHVIAFAGFGFLIAFSLLYLYLG
ncbi:MAG: divalent metal cation transporter [Vicingaceae bacterium]